MRLNVVAWRGSNQSNIKRRKAKIKALVRMPKTKKPGAQASLAITG